MFKNSLNAHRSFCLTLILAAFLFFAITIFATPNGQWIESAVQGACPDGQICAEWEEEGIVKLTCCIDPQFLGTNNANACATVRP